MTCISRPFYPDFHAITTFKFWDHHLELIFDDNSKIYIHKSEMQTTVVYFNHNFHLEIRLQKFDFAFLIHFNSCACNLKTPGIIMSENYSELSISLQFNPVLHNLYN